MSWFSLLKMPNPFGGKWEDLTRDEYYRMDDMDKSRYHNSRRDGFVKRRKALVAPRKAGQAPPATDDQIRELREVYRFHSRQFDRLRHGFKKETFYSLDEENNRQLIKPQFDAVERSHGVCRLRWSASRTIWGRLRNS